MPKISVTALRSVGDTGIPSSLGTDPVTPPRDQLGIDTVLVRVGLLARVALGDTLPHHSARRFVAGTDRETERLGRLERPREPEPGLVLLAAHIRPDLITLDRV